MNTENKIKTEIIKATEQRTEHYVNVVNFTYPGAVYGVLTTADALPESAINIATQLLKLNKCEVVSSKPGYNAIVCNNTMITMAEGAMITLDRMKMNEDGSFRTIDGSSKHLDDSYIVLDESRLEYLISYFMSYVNANSPAKTSKWFGSVIPPRKISIKPVFGLSPTKNAVFLYKYLPNILDYKGFYNVVEVISKCTTLDFVMLEYEHIDKWLDIKERRDNSWYFHCAHLKCDFMWTGGTAPSFVYKKHPMAPHRNLHSGLS